MKFIFKPITEDQALALLSWRYDPPYDFYNGSDDPIQQERDVAEYLDPTNACLAALDQAGRLVGFFCFGQTAQVPGGDYATPAIDIGLGLHPDLTGQGLGLAYVQAVLDMARQKFGSNRPLRLTVATFNRRAIRVYERVGFRPVETFMSTMEPHAHEFVQMVWEK